MRNTADLDLYRVLEVSRYANHAEIRASYRALARQHHPDAGGDSVRMATLNRAWEVLGDAELRASYDAEQQVPREAAPPPPRPVGSVLDFGRYAGWSIGALAVEDPDYLDWLRRAPIGRRLRPEIDARLAERRTARASESRPEGRRTSRLRWARS